MMPVLLIATLVSTGAPSDVPASEVPASPAAGLAPRAAAVRAPALWWEAGHATVCDIAWRELLPSAKTRIHALLALDPQYDELGPSCYWPDRVRAAGGYEAYESAHYVNLPRGAVGYEAERDCARRLCVVEAIPLMAGRLRDPDVPDAEKLTALKFLGHFVGDIHQPLHVGYGDDLGGNRIHACVPTDDSTNLHAVWDGFIVGRRMAADGSDWKVYGARLHAEIRPTHRREWGSADPRDWANESYALVEDEVYGDPLDACLTGAYAAAHAETVERRLKQAGVRLGALLNRLFAARPEAELAAASDAFSATTMVGGGGWEAYAAFLHDDFTRWSSGGEIQRRGPFLETLRDWWEGGGRMSSSSSETLSIEVSGDVGIVRRRVAEGYVDGEGRPAGAFDGVASLTWVRTPTGWKLLAAEISPAPTP